MALAARSQGGGAGGCARDADTDAVGCRRRAALLSAGRARSPNDGSGAGRARGRSHAAGGGRGLGGRVGMFDHAGGGGRDGAVGEDAPLARGRGELRQLEVGRGRLEAALEIVKAHRGQKVKGCGGRVGWIVGGAIPSAKGKERVVVGRRGTEHWSVGGGSADGSNLCGTGARPPPISDRREVSRPRDGQGMLVCWRLESRLAASWGRGGLTLG